MPLHPDRIERAPDPSRLSSAHASVTDDRAIATGRVVGAALVLCLLLIAVRAFAADPGFGPGAVGTTSAVLTVLLGGGFDVLFVLGMAAVALGLLRVRLGRRAIAPCWIDRGFVVAATAVLLGCLANVPVVRWIGRPLNFQWFYYSGFLRSAEARSAVAENLPWWALGGAIALCAAYVVTARRAGGWLCRHSRDQKRGGLRRLAVVGGVSLLYVVASIAWLGWTERDRHRFANPVWAFAVSAFQPDRTPVLFSMITPYDAEDFLSEADSAGDAASVLPPKRHVPRNVVVFVMETLAMRYTDLHGQGYGATPTLKREAARAASFRNIYAHAPVTNKTLVSLLCGVYPRVTFRFETDATPQIDLPNLPAMLRERGYVTGFFSGAPLDFQGAGTFLAAGGKFDFIEDCKDRERDGVRFTSEWEAISGSADLTTVESAIRWIEPRAQQPFFAVVWTIQPHYPYFIEGEERTIVEDPYFNRYLNAVEQSDRAFARLMAWLDEKGLSDSTLVVCVGDHGEAFGQHNNSGHGSHIYEENIHVPLLLINPRLFSGEVYDTIGGTADLGATIAELLRVPADPRWHGRSLFSTRRTERVYFFAPWSDYLLGMREREHKVIYNATTDTFEVFDLARDPLEKVNLASESDEAIADAMLRMAAWAQKVERTYRDALATP